MQKVAQLFIQELESKGLKYYPPEDRNGKTLITIGMQLHTTNVRINVIFDEDGTSVALRLYGLVRVNDDQYPSALMACNELNAKKRWVKFYIDSDNDVNLEDDAVIDEYTVGAETFELLMRMCSIADDAYPVIMKAIYGGN